MKLPLIVVACLLCLAQGIGTFVHRPAGPLERQRIAIENWMNYGYFELKGRYVDQIESLTQAQMENPPTFAGHQPLVFLPTYICSVLTGSIPIGHIFGSIIWMFGLSIALGLAFGRSGWLPSLAILSSPAVIAGIATMDPVPLTLLFLLPFFVAVSSDLFSSPSVSTLRRIILITLASVAVFLSWTSALALAIWAPTWIFKAAIEKKLTKVAPYVGFLCVASVIALVFDLSSKQGNMTTPDFKDYFFLSTGYYGAGMTWSKAITKQTAVAVFMLWPGWLLISFIYATRAKKIGSRTAVIGCIPVALMIILYVLLRNYTAHASLLVAAPIAIHAVTALLWAIWTHLQSNQLLNPSSRLLTTGYPTLILFSSSAMVILWGALLFPMNWLRETLDSHTKRDDLVVIDPALWPSPDFSPDYHSRLMGRKVSLGNIDELPTGSTCYYLSATHPQDPNFTVREFTVIPVSPPFIMIWLDKLFSSIQARGYDHLLVFLRNRTPLLRFDALKEKNRLLDFLRNRTPLLRFEAHEKSAVEAVE
jgi:hypothetical protein